MDLISFRSRAASPFPPVSYRILDAIFVIVASLSCRIMCVARVSVVKFSNSMSVSFSYNKAKKSEWDISSTFCLEEVYSAIVNQVA